MTSEDDLRHSVKSVARRQFAAAGADAITPEAIAEAGELPRDRVMSLFTDRDSVVTELLLDAYNASGEAMEHAVREARERGESPGRQLLAATRALRNWAWENTGDFTLVYGSPIPGYHAPQDTVPPASRTPAVIADVLHAALADGSLRPVQPVPGPPLITDEAIALFGGVPEEPFSDLIERGIVFWSNLAGLLHFDIFTRTHDSVRDQAAFFDYAIAVAAQNMGLDIATDQGNSAKSQ